MKISAWWMVIATILFAIMISMIVNAPNENGVTIVNMGAWTGVQ